jgi:hypothetical protein
MSFSVWARPDKSFWLLQAKLQTNLVFSFRDELEPAEHKVSFFVHVVIYSYKAVKKLTRTVEKS